MNHAAEESTHPSFLANQEKAADDPDANDEAESFEPPPAEDEGVDEDEDYPIQGE